VLFETFDRSSQVVYSLFYNGFSYFKTERQGQRKNYKQRVFEK